MYFYSNSTQTQIASQLKICSDVPTINHFSKQNPSCWHRFRTILCSKSHKHSPKHHFVNLLKPTMSEETTNSILTRPRSNNGHPARGDAKKSCSCRCCNNITHIFLSIETKNTDEGISRNDSFALKVDTKSRMLKRKM